MKYVILESASAQNLADAVNDKMANGAQLVGGVSYDSNEKSYLQAILVETPVESTPSIYETQGLTTL
jgi:hypothetical protein